MNEYEKYIKEQCSRCKYKDEQDYCSIRKDLKGELRCVNKEE